MSAKVFALVLDYPFTHTQKAVMLALANQCNEFGQHCYPGFDLIQRHTSLGRRTIFDALAQLEQGGFVTRLQRGRSQQVEFRIHVEALQQPDLPGLEPEDGTGMGPKKSSAGAAPVRQAHRCENRTGAADSETGAAGAPAGAGAALHKAPGIYPTAPKSEKRSPTGSRLPPDWTPSEEDLEFARTERPHLDVRAEAAKFRDYWHSVAGAKGRKADWAAVWRNWIRRTDATRSPPVTNTSGPNRSTPGPSETPLERELNWLRQQNSYGAFTPEEYQRRVAEATTKHRRKAA